MTENTSAVVTIVRDDIFLLKRFVAYYGGMLGCENVYIINHGNEPDVNSVAGNCNVIPIPARETNNFTILKSRTMNHIKDALRQWYTHVIVCDVDEFIVVDPASGMTLRTWLDAATPGTIYSAMGMEIVHLRDRERGEIEDGIIGPRMFAQIDQHYAKPCVISRAARLARGGHYADYRKLNLPDFLYLFHMKYCDFDLYAETLDRRQAFVAEQARHGDGRVRSNPQWFGEDRDDDAIFDAFQSRPIDRAFDLAPVRQGMHDRWEKRNEHFWHFKRQTYHEIFELPARFAGVDRGH